MYVCMYFYLTQHWTHLKQFVSQLVGLDPKVDHRVVLVWSQLCGQSLYPFKNK